MRSNITFPIKVSATKLSYWVWPGVSLPSSFLLSSAALSFDLIGQESPQQEQQPDLFSVFAPSLDFIGHEPSLQQFSPQQQESFSLLAVLSLLFIGQESLQQQSVLETDWILKA
jgi:hypothetical protein